MLPVWYRLYGRTLLLVLNRLYRSALRVLVLYRLYRSALRVIVLYWLYRLTLRLSLLPDLRLRLI